MNAEKILSEHGPWALMAIVLSVVVWKLFNLWQASHERELAREVTRADNAQKQLDELNTMVREQLVPLVVRATDASSRVTELLAEQRHSGGWKDRQ